LAWREGDEAALARLTPLVHAELQRIARRCMRGQPRDHTLQATALVNEAYLRLVDVQEMNWQSRAHFLAMAARLMRRVLVDSARARGSHKRGGEAVRVSFSEELAVTDSKGLDIVGLDVALHALAELDERQSRVVELRFFGGLSVAETAAVLGISGETVMRDWKVARAWLMREMKAQPHPLGS
jgi:RNA polymerase sigma factor (TIGR02999 family)